MRKCIYYIYLIYIFTYKAHGTMPDTEKHSIVLLLLV